MTCPKCGNERTGVIKKLNGLNFDLRNRYCRECNFIFASFEVNISNELYSGLERKRNNYLKSMKGIFQELIQNGEKN